MPAKKKKSSLADRIRQTDARAESKTAEVVYSGGGSLPAGVEGTAVLTRVDFDEIKKGKYAGSQRFYCHGTCLEPATFTDSNGNVIKTAGKLVQPGMITLDDTKSDFGEASFAENLAKAEMRLKQLGFPTEDFDDELDEEAIAYFRKREEDDEPMYFEFRTWQPDGSSRVNVQITGIPANYSPPDEDDDLDEGDSDSDDDDDSSDSDDDNEPDLLAEEDLDELVRLADDEDDEDAKAKLEKLAADAGKSDEEIESAENWAEVAGWLSEDSDDDSDDNDAPTEPEKGDQYSFKPPRSKKLYKCEVTSVNKKNQTVTLKNLEKDGTYKLVPWDSLE